MDRTHLVPKLITDKNGVKRIYYINPDDAHKPKLVKKYIKNAVPIVSTAISSTISLFYNPDNRPQIYVEGDNGEDIVFDSDELDGLSESVQYKIDNDIRDGEIWNRGNISIILKDGWDYTPEDDKVIIKDHRTNRRIVVDWSDVRRLANKNDMIVKALGRSRKRIKANLLKGGDVVDLYPDMMEAYNNLTPEQQESEQGEMLAVLIQEAEENYFLIQEVEHFNDHVTLYNGKGDSFDVSLNNEIYVASHDVTGNPEWGDID